MRQRTILALALAGAVALPAFAAPLAEELLKASDQALLGKRIAKFIDAKDGNSGVDKVKEDFSKDLDGLKKKLKDRDVLACPADLGKALWLAYEYESKKGVSKGKVKDVPFTAKFYGDKAQLTYAVWVPAKYDPKRAYPLVLCIPEKGVKPAQHLTEKWIDPQLRDGAILVGIPMPDDVMQWTEPGSPELPGGFANVMLTLREVRQVYAIDYDRIFLAGRGEGVAAAWSVAARSPDRFAGVIGRSGDLGAKGPGHENFKSLPSLFAGAGANATSFSEKCTKDGYNNCALKPEALEPEIWAWIQDHPRTGTPAEVLLYPGKPTPNKAYWIEVPPTDYKPEDNIRAKADKATNTITIEASDGISKVTLYLNDDIIDLEKEVKVICNGAEHIDKIPRNTWQALDWMYQSVSDPGRIFTASKQYDVPAKPKPKEPK